MYSPIILLLLYDFVKFYTLYFRLVSASSVFTIHNKLCNLKHFFFKPQPQCSESDKGSLIVRIF